MILLTKHHGRMILYFVLAFMVLTGIIYLRAKDEEITLIYDWIKGIIQWIGILALVGFTYLAFRSGRVLKSTLGYCSFSVKDLKELGVMLDNLREIEKEEYEKSGKPIIVPSRRYTAVKKYYKYNEMIDRIKTLVEHETSKKIKKRFNRMSINELKEEVIGLRNEAKTYLKDFYRNFNRYEKNRDELNLKAMIESYDEYYIFLRKIERLKQAIEQRKSDIERWGIYYYAQENREEEYNRSKFVEDLEIVLNDYKKMLEMQTDVEAKMEYTKKIKVLLEAIRQVKTQ